MEAESEDRRNIELGNTLSVRRIWRTEKEMQSAVLKDFLGEDPTDEQFAHLKAKEIQCNDSYLLYFGPATLEMKLGMAVRKPRGRFIFFYVRERTDKLWDNYLRP